MRCGRRCRGARRDARPRHRQPPNAGDRPVHVLKRHAAGGHARPQPLLSRVVTRRAARRLPRPDRVADRRQHPVGGHGCRARRPPTTSIDPPPADRLGELQTRFASQLHVEPNDVTIELGLNTGAAPFTDVRVRRALNYAIDRATRGTARWDRTRTPPARSSPPSSPDISATAPTRVTRPPRDLERSRPRQGSSPDCRLGHPRDADHDLERAGIPHGLHRGRALPRRTAQPPRLPNAHQKRQLRQQFVLTGLEPANQSSSLPQCPRPRLSRGIEFLGPEYNSCRSFVARDRSDPRASLLRSRIRRDRPPRARRGIQQIAHRGELWAKADRQFTDQAPVVPLATPSIIDFVSHRVGNYQYNPQLGRASRPALGALAPRLQFTPRRNDHLDLLV